MFQATFQKIQATLRYFLDKNYKYNKRINKM